MAEKTKQILSGARVDPPLYKIVLTGGPCGGKTTALERVSSYLRERGFEVMTCPEAYTMLITNGFSFDNSCGTEKDLQLKVQHSVMDLMISIEDSFERVLRAKGRPAVLICDRGVMDGSAYLPREEWDEFILSREGNLNNVELREGRYNAIFHLVTAAEGAEKYYSLSNNVARTETIDEAKKIDALTRNAWAGHPHLRVFDNSVDFETKMQRLVKATSKLVGLPSDAKKETTKFLLKQIPNITDFPSQVRYHVFDVEKVFLHVNSDSEETEYSYVRKRALKNSVGASFGYTNIQKTKEGQIIELKRIITEREYNEYLKFKDKSRGIIKQMRVAFVWETQSFNIHTYIQPVDGVSILHCQSDPSEEIRVPPFLEVEKKLTNSPDDVRKFGSVNISQQVSDKAE